MTGLVTIDFTQPTNEKEIMANPLGLFVSDFLMVKGTLKEVLYAT